MHEKLKCPFNRKPCMKRDCHLWEHVRGQHPQTGVDMDFEECSFKINTILALDAGRSIKSVAAAIESTRNEMVGIAIQRMKEEKKLVPEMKLAIGD